jgi:uncharacterized protein (TIGR03546 family)
VLLLKLLQQLIRTLNSNGTPGQVAAGIALGSVFGLTPLLNIHNLVLFLAAMVLNLSLAGVFLGWAIFTPAGFALDPLFDRIGHALLGAEGLAGMWTALTNTPGVGLTNFNNTVVLGSFVFWVVAWLPLFFFARWLVAKYRATIYERLRNTKAFKAVTASKLFNVYRVFRPE